MVCGPDGIVAIPPEKAEQIALEAVEQQRLDLWLQREAEKGGSLYGLLPPDSSTLARFEAETARLTPVFFASSKVIYFLITPSNLLIFLSLLGALLSSGRGCAARAERWR